MGFFKKTSPEDKIRQRQEFAKVTFPLHQDIQVYYIGENSSLTLTNKGIWTFTYRNGSWHNELYSYDSILDYQVASCPDGNMYKYVIFKIIDGTETIERRTRIKAVEMNIIVEFLNEAIQSARQAESASSQDDSNEITWDDLESLAGSIVKAVTPVCDDFGEETLGVCLTLGQRDSEGNENEVLYMNFFDGNIKLIRR